MDAVKEFSEINGFVWNPKIEIRDLKDRGKCVVACQSINPHENLMKVPIQALVSIDKILDLNEEMSTHELLAEYLLTLKNKWVDNLPQNFDSMPVSWEPSRVAKLPMFLQLKIANQRKELQNYLEKTKFDKNRAEWAWKAVNTRCLYWEKGGMTMAPILDFLNHNADEKKNASVNHGPFGFIVKSKRKYSEGEEITFSYGAHDNGRLLVEYGFITADNSWNYMDITPELENVFASQQSFLTKHGYWGEWTIDLEGCPSYRLEVAIAALSDQKYAYQMILGYEDGSKIDSRAFLAPICTELATKMETNLGNDILVDQLLTEYIHTLRLV